MLTLVAVGVFVAMCGAISGLILEQYAKVHAVNAAYLKIAEIEQRSSSEEAARACQDVERGVVFRDCIADQLKSYYAKRSANDDLRVQKDMAFWAFWLFIVSFFGVGLLALTFWETLRTARAAEDAVRIADKTAERQLRAYVGVEYVSIFDTREGQTPTVSIAYKNFGQTPAVKIQLRSAYAISGPGLPDFDDLPDLQGWNLPLNPNHEAHTLNKIDPEAWRHGRSALEMHTKTFYLYGRINYLDAFDRERSTKFRYEMQVSDDGIVDGTPFIVCEHGNDAT